MAGPNIQVPPGMKLLKDQQLNITVVNGGSQSVYYNLFNSLPLNPLISIPLSYSETILSAGGIYEDGSENQRTYNFTFINNFIVFPPSNKGNAKRYDATLALQQTYAFDSGFGTGGPTGVFYHSGSGRLYAFGVNSNAGTGNGVQYYDTATGTYSTVKAFDAPAAYMEFVNGTDYAFYIDNTNNVNYLDCNAFTLNNTGKTVFDNTFQWYEYDSTTGNYVIGISNGGSTAKIYTYNLTSNVLTFISNILVFSGRIWAGLYNGSVWYVGSSDNYLYKLNLSSSTITNYPLYASPSGVTMNPYIRLPRLAIDTDRGVIAVQHGGTIPASIILFDISSSSIIGVITENGIASIGNTVYDPTSKTFIMAELSAPDLYSFYYSSTQGNYNTLTPIHTSAQLIHDLRTNGLGIIVGGSDSAVDYDVTSIDYSSVTQTWPQVTVNGNATSVPELTRMVLNNPITFKLIHFSSTRRDSYLNPMYFTKGGASTAFCEQGVSLYFAGTAYDYRNIVDIKPENVGLSNILGADQTIFKKIPASTTESVVIDYDQLIVDLGQPDGQVFQNTTPKPPKKTKYVHSHFKFWLR
jgi:hypothetical protein